jgi:hypothetical protein
MKCAIPHRRCRVPRRGGAMVYVLILLLMISMMGTSLVRGTIAQHRQRQNDELRAQTVRLAEAGWNRALRTLAVHPDYAGETWRIGGDALPSARDALVTIEIQALNAGSGQRTLRVRADYPVDSPQRNRVTLEERL